MEWKEARVLALKEIKITHKDFLPDEWLIMKGNKIIFEDGVEMDEKTWLNWSNFSENWFEFE